MNSLVVLVWLASLAPAEDERRFGYSWEARAEQVGFEELQQSVQLKARKDAGEYRRWDMRTGSEVGFLDRGSATLGVDWNAEHVESVPGLTDRDTFRLTGLTVEPRWKFTDPHESVGLLLYSRFSVEYSHHYSIESKDGTDTLSRLGWEMELRFVASSEWGPVTLAYNLSLEHARTFKERRYEGSDWETEYLISNTVGANVEVLKGLRIGAEGLSRTGFRDDLSDSLYTTYFVGPSIQFYRVEGIWFTLTVLKQVDLQEHAGLELNANEKYEVRFVIGISF